MRGIFNTGPIKHEAALVGDYLKTQNCVAQQSAGDPDSASNIYNPTFIPAAQPLRLPHPAAPLASDSVLPSIGIVDALSLNDDMFQIIGGARQQRLQNANYNAVTGLPTNGNDKSVVSPSASFVFKPVKEFMLYGNYIQALQQGPIARRWA